MEALHGLSAQTLRELAAAIRSGRLAFPGTELGLRAYVHADARPSVVAALRGLETAASSREAAALLLDAIAEARARALAAAPQLELVWTGPEVSGSGSRDTRVVVEELMRLARSNILIAGFAIYDGLRVLGTLAQRMDSEPELSVRLFVNIGRERGDNRPNQELVIDYRSRFMDSVWPGQRMPRVYFDPRALSSEPGPRASMHAKCIVVDNDLAFVTSANLTSAAQERNIEAGVLVRDPAFALGLRRQFEGLVSRGDLTELALAHR